MPTTSRRQRQVDALRAMCREGDVARAVDLAFEHFAAFGRDDEIVEVLADAMTHAPVADAVRRRFAELKRER